MREERLGINKEGVGEKTHEMREMRIEKERKR